MGEVPVESLVPTDDLSAWLGEPISEQADRSRARSVIEYAFTLVETEIDRDLAYWAEYGLPNPVRQVVLQAASRGYSNPDSWKSERLDDWQGSGRPVEELGMYLTPTEKRNLRKFAEVKRTGIGVIDTRRDDPLEIGFRPWFDPDTGGLPDWRRY